MRARRSAVAAALDSAGAFQRSRRRRRHGCSVRGRSKGRSVGKCAAALQVSERDEVDPTAPRSANRAISATKRFRFAARALMRGRGFNRAQRRRRRDRADLCSFPAAVCGDARRRGWQYGAAIGDAGDRPRDRDQGFLRRHRLHLVGGAVGAARALLGGEERPSRPENADHDGRQRLRRFDDPVRDRLVQRPSSLDRRGADFLALRDLPRDLRRASAARRRRRRKPISLRRRGAAGELRPCPPCRPRSAWGRSSARRSRPCSCCLSSALPGRCSRSR